MLAFNMKSSLRKVRLDFRRFLESCLRSSPRREFEVPSSKELINGVLSYFQLATYKITFKW